MNSYSSRQLLTSLLQFFALDAGAQLGYAKGIPEREGERSFPFGLDHSPLIEMASATHNIARVFSSEKDVLPTAVETLEEFETLVQLVLGQSLKDYGTVRSLRNDVEWRLIRRLSRVCLREMGIPATQPQVPYDELVPLTMD